jgi:hypothetical protein
VKKVTFGAPSRSVSRTENRVCPATTSATSPTKKCARGRFAAGALDEAGGGEGAGDFVVEVCAAA